MSRAFVKEDADDGNELPDRPQTPGPNYVTPRGKSLLDAKLTELAAQLSKFPAVTDDSDVRYRRRMITRDIRYFRGRLETAVVVDNTENPPEDIRIGAAVEAKDDFGEVHRFIIVGEDEADIDSGRIGWATPLAGSLLGLKTGEKAIWARPAGDLPLRIVSVRYAND